MPGSSWGPSAPSTSRAVPLAVRVAVLTHGPIRQVGWFALAFGVVLCTALLTHTDFGRAPYDAHTDGTVLRVDPPAPRPNRDTVYTVDVQVDLGGARVVRSYTSTPPQPGDVVTVDYDSQDPDDACLQGARRQRFSRWTLVTLLFPAFGLFFATRRLAQARRAHRLLHHGHPAQARVVRKSQGPDSVNDTSETVVRLEFQDAGGVPHAIDEPTFVPERLGDDARELVLYDPRAPAHATAIDHLPGKLDVQADRVIARAPVTRLLILPALGGLSMLACALWLLMR